MYSAQLETLTAELTLHYLLVLALCISSAVLHFTPSQPESVENSGTLGKSNNEMRLESQDQAVFLQIVILHVLVTIGEGLYYDLLATVKIWAQLPMIRRKILLPSSGQIYLHGFLTHKSPIRDYHYDICRSGKYLEGAANSLFERNIYHEFRSESLEENCKCLDNLKSGKDCNRVLY
jgi:hypothetical protein